MKKNKNIVVMFRQGDRVEGKEINYKKIIIKQLIKLLIGAFVKIIITKLMLDALRK